MVQLLRPSLLTFERFSALKLRLKYSSFADSSFCVTSARRFGTSYLFALARVLSLQTGGRGDTSRAGTAVVNRGHCGVDAVTHRLGDKTSSIAFPRLQDRTDLFFRNTDLATEAEEFDNPRVFTIILDGDLATVF
jgi:hypothetical protein